MLAGEEESRAVAPRAAATIARYLVNVGWAYRMAGGDDPTAAPLVRLELKALGVRQRQAKGIRIKGDVLDIEEPASGICLAHLLASCERDCSGLRDAALLRTAYDTGCRRSELVAIVVGQIVGPDGEGAGTLLIPRSKADREGEGAIAYLAPATMRAIEAWQHSAGIERGPLFRWIEAYLDGVPRAIGEGPLHAGSVTLIYKAAGPRRPRQGAARQPERDGARALDRAGFGRLEAHRLQQLLLARFDQQCVEGAARACDRARCGRRLTGRPIADAVGDTVFRDAALSVCTQAPRSNLASWEDRR